MKNTYLYSINKESMDKNSPSTLNAFELGDLILIDAPANPQLHDHTFFIKYIDDEKIKLVNLQDRSLVQLNLNESQEIKDESIHRIILKSRSKDKGFARQMGLLPGKWINIHFGGEFPHIDVGQITNLEEDMIEITILSENIIYYIDFEYKGIPEYLPLEKIVVRDRPSILKNDDVVKQLNGELKNPHNLSIAIESINQKIVNSLDNDEPVTEEPDRLAPSIGSKSPANIEPDAYIPNLLTAMYLDANDILEENIGEYVQLVEVGEKEKRYTLETQVSNIADKLIGKIPVGERTASAAEKIQNIISKFKQLRTKYSVLDENGNVIQPRRLNAFHKPIIDKISAFERQLGWILPVVYAQKKVFFDKELDDEDNLNPAIYYANADESIAKDELIYTEYKNKKIGRGERSLKYDKLLEDIDRGMHPYLNSSDGYSARATACIDAIIEHLDGFQSYTVSGILKGKKDDTDSILIAPKDFITTRFIEGQTKLVTETARSGKKTQKRNKVTEDEALSVKSLVMLPESIVKHSRVHLPSTGILTRAELAMTDLHLSKVLNNSVNIDNVVLYDLNKQVEYDEDGVDGDNRGDVMPVFLEKVRHYLVGGDISIETREKFEEFLNAIFPNIRTLIRLMEKYMTDCFSLLKIVEILEPFAIYSDTISFNQYKEIRYFLKEKIKKEKIALNEKSKEFFNYSQIAGSGTASLDWSDEFFKSNTNYLSWLKKTYGVLDDSVEVGDSNYTDAADSGKKQSAIKRTGSETMGLLNSIDNGAFMTKLVNHRMFSLFTPDNIMKVIETGKDEDIGEIKEKTKCGGPRLFLSKKYRSIATMQKDNGVDELDYDKEFDDTPYHILDMYKGKQKEMQEDKFMEFFSVVLEEKHGCPHHLAKPLAKTIIRGKKLVAPGDYAVVEVKDSVPTDESADATREPNVPMPMQIYYYKRQGTVWVHDKDIEDQAFMDTNQLFCNLKSKKGECVQQSTNGDAPQTLCLDNKQSIANMQSILKTKVLKEFDKRLELSLEQLKEKIEKELVSMRECVDRCRKLKLAELYHTNNIAYRLGRNEHISHSETASIQSPYIDLRDMILSQTDYVKKQDDIVLFNEVYTREPNVEQGENKYWLYCKETNTKLFPFSLFKLASAFKYDYDKYDAVMSAVIRDVGTMSEDGEAIIDKHTNYELKKIEFAEQELYDDQGFRIHTHELAEEDTVKQVASALSEKLSANANTEKVFEDETTQVMYNISVKLLRDMGVAKTEVDDLQIDALTIAKPMVSKIISEKEYDKKKKEGEKNTGKKSTMPPYEMYRDKMLIFLSACAVLIVVQTKMPNIRLVKTFPGCVRATDGYPLELDAVEKMGGMKYISCILLKLASKIRPWNSIEQIKNVESMVKNMRTVMDERYLKNMEIQAKYAAKRDYLKENPIVNETSVPKEHAVEKWVNFMPPLIEYSIEKTLQGVSSDFKKELITMMRNGHRDQDMAINVLRSKILAHTYGIAELINKIVRQREPLLTTRSGNIPFMENACCNETPSKTALSYFISENPNVDVFNKRCKNMSVLLSDVRMLSKPSILYHPLPTNIQYKKVPDEYLEETIYSAIIHYCKLDRPVPVPVDYHAILTDKIPGYDRGATIKEKMETMKSNGKIFGVDHLNQLMTIVNRANRVEGISFSEKSIVQINGLKDFILGIDELDSSKIENNMIDAKLRRLLLETITDYKPTIIVSETRTSEDALRRHIRKMNSEMQEGVFLFLRENGNLDKKMEKTLREFLQGGVEQWNLDEIVKDDSTMPTAEHSLYTIAQYVKSSIYSLVKMYPNQIMNRHVYNLNAIPENWKLSHNNKMDLESWFHTTLAGLKRFEGDGEESGNVVISDLIRKIDKMFVNLTLFVDILPILAPIYRWSEKEQKTVEFYSFLSKSTYLLLLKYCWLSVWHGYVMAIDERRMRELEHKLNLQEKINMRETEVASTMESFIPVDDLEMDIVAGMDKNAKRIVGELMVEMMKIEMRTKNMFNYSYSEIEKKIYKTKEDEKREITDYLGGMDDEERAVENMLKKFKLGRWGVGLDKSLFKYDRERYDKERETTNQRLRDELMGVGDNDLFVHHINALTSGTSAEGELIGESMTADELEAMEDSQFAADYDLEDREIRVEEEYMGEFDEYDEGFDEE